MVELNVPFMVLGEDEWKGITVYRYGSKEEQVLYLGILHLFSIAQCNRGQARIDWDYFGCAVDVARSISCLVDLLSSKFFCHIRIGTSQGYHDYSFL